MKSLDTETVGERTLRWINSRDGKCITEGGTGCYFHTCHDCYCFRVEGFGLAGANHEISKGVRLDAKESVLPMVAKVRSLPGAFGFMNQCGQCGRDVSTCTCDFGV